MDQQIFEAFYNPYRYGFQIGYFNSEDQIQAGIKLGWLNEEYAQKLRDEFLNK